jgi:putative membrane protein
MKEKKIPLFKKILLLVGVMLIPTIYSLCYLQAYWNPYNSVDKLPIAVVNNDNGAVINSKQENLGNELVTDLKKSDSLKCSFVGSEEAETGAEANKYYAVITVPADFSKDISSASTTNKKTATIDFEPNQEHSYIASMLLRSAVDTIVNNLRGNVNKEITTSLTNQLQNIPLQLHTLGNGLNTLTTGANKLQNGILDVSNGQKALLKGTASLDSGLDNLSIGGAELNTNIGLLNGGLGQALLGAKQLNAGAGNLSALSTGITSLNTAAAQVSAGLGQLLAQFGTNSKVPTLHDNIDALNGGAKSVADQFADGSTSNLKYVVNSLSDKTSGAPAYVGTVNSLVTVLRNDTGVYNSILSSLGSADASSKPAYANALVLLTDTNSSTEVSYTVSALSAFGITSKDAITAQQNALMGGGTAITQAVSVLASQFSTAVSGQPATLYDGVTQLASGTTQLDSQMATSTDKNNPTLFDSVNQLSLGASQISAGTGQLAKSAPQLIQLKDGVNRFESVLQQLKNGSSQLYAGSNKLIAGASAAKTGSSQLALGSAKLTSGMNTVQNGAAQLAAGMSKAGNSVNTSADTADKNIAATKGLASYTQNPVTMKETDIDPVSDYGTAFAPFFLSLSLWIGAIMMFFGIHFDVIKRIKILSPNTQHVVTRTILFLLIGIVQAVALGLIIQNSLSLHIVNPVMYYFACILFSLVAVSIVQFLIVNVGDLGKLFSILMLIFSLTSCGGTFPVETVPNFYSSLNRFMPMTYSIDLLRQAIIGYNAASAHFDIIVEVVIAVIFTSLTIGLLLFKRSNVKEEKTEIIKAKEDLAL